MTRAVRPCIALALLLALFAAAWAAPPVAAAPPSIDEFPLPAPDSGPLGIAVGPDGNLWFAQFFGNRIGRITPAGAITEFPLPAANSRPYDIAAGPDGNLWFVEYLGNAIGRITPTGVITEFPLPAPVSIPIGIAAGPDGNLWFTEFGGNRIGRITPAGAITEFALPSPDSRPSDIVAGPDGNLWFTEGTGNRIGRISPTGTITEFPLPNPASDPTGIVAGPDGNLWFTEYGGNRIGRITPAGVLSEFPLPTADSGPRYIAVGPDGNLWFALYFGNAIGRITPTGVITEFPLPSAGRNPEGIAAGPDGNLWFTEFGGNRIGRLNRFRLTVAAQGPGAVAPGPGDYVGGEVATLIATPGAGAVFLGWHLDGVARGWASPLTLTMDAPHDLAATFAVAPPFGDVPPGHPAAEAIAELAGRGIARGYAGGGFGPGDTLQRAQLAAFVARAMPGSGALAPPACLVPGTWDCEDWGNPFTDRGGLDANLWRNVGTLAHYGVAVGYGDGRFGPTDPVTHAQASALIARAMVAKGYWQPQPGAPVPIGVPAAHAADVATFRFYTGGTPVSPADWNAPATRGWCAQALWAAIDGYWGTDGTLPDGRPAGGLVP